MTEFSWLGKSGVVRNGSIDRWRPRSRRKFNAEWKHFEVGRVVAVAGGVPAAG